MLKCDYTFDHVCGPVTQRVWSDISQAWLHSCELQWPAGVTVQRVYPPNHPGPIRGGGHNA